MKKTLLFWVIWAAGCLMNLAQAQQIKVVGYMPSWAGSASSIQYSKLTHINYSFALPNWDGTLKPLDNPSKLQQIVSSAHAQGKKVFIACGGWTDNGEDLDPRFESIAANVTYRNNLVNGLVNLVNQYGLDGVDMDWEYPNTGASSTNFYNLMKGLYDRLSPIGKGLSAAVGVSSYSGDGIPSSVFPLVDHLNLMAYDDGGANHSTYNFAVSALNYWTARGLPASKQILGVPFYARPSWNGFGVLLSQGADPYADFFGSDGYNGITTIQNKTRLAISRAGGIMIWELSQDAVGQYSLLSAIDVIVKQNTGTNQAPNVSITSPANGAAFNSPATITINATASDADGTVSKVEFFNGSTLLGTDNSSPYSYTWSGVGNGTYSITAKATDDKGATKVSSAVSVTVSTPATQSPYAGVIAIPGTLQAENYDLGGSGVAYSDASAANEGNAFRTDAVDLEASTEGGYNVGWTAAGEWLEYTVNVTKAGTYNISARVASINAGKSFHLEMNGVKVGGSFNVPNTGGWQTWQTVTLSNVTLNAGQQILRVVMDTDGFNLNSLTFVSTTTTTNQPPAVSLTAPAANATYTAPATITITANASDLDGTISKVDFYNGSTLLFSDNSAPYSYTWTGVAAGTYSITATATDNQGAASKTGAVSVKVNPGNVGTCTTQAWTASGVYTGGVRVSRNGNIYEAKWWTQGEDPLQWSGQWDVWKLIGPCGARYVTGSALIEGEGVSPNPASERTVVTIYASVMEETMVQVVSTSGVIVAQYPMLINEGWNEITLNLTDVPTGVYVVKAGERVFRMVVR